MEPVLKRFEIDAPLHWNGGSTKVVEVDAVKALRRYLMVACGITGGFIKRMSDTRLRFTDSTGTYFYDIKEIPFDEEP